MNCIYTYKIRLTLFVLLLLPVNILFAGIKEDNLMTLSGVNPYWIGRNDVAQFISKNAIDDRLPHRELIAVHLNLVAEVLEAVPVNHLSPQQQENRFRMLGELRHYAGTGAFPFNEVLPFRNPVFIDAQDHFCAVGHLLKVSGHEEVSRMIAATDNMEYVATMTYPELLVWADAYGFTTEELAWIQPGYQPAYAVLQQPGAGLPGNVHAFYIEAGYGGNMIAGGDFAFANNNGSGHVIKGISYYNFIEQQWFPYAEGITGVVQAIEIQGEILYAGGQFTTAGTATVSNIAVWNGQTWAPLGALNGPVYTLKMLDGVLYAGGLFSSNVIGNSYHNFAKWNGSAWVSAGISFNGAVRVIEEVFGNLYIGGSFDHCGSFPANNIVGFDGQNAFPMGSGVPGPVRAITYYQERIFCGGEFLHNAHYFALQSFNPFTDSWEGEINPASFSTNYDVSNYYIDDLAIVTHTDGTEDLLIGGNFVFNDFSSMETPSSNMVRLVNGSYFTGENNFNGPVRCIEMINGTAYGVAGDFTQSATGMINHIGFISPSSEIEKEQSNKVQMHIYPNPASEFVYIEILTETPLKSIKLVNASGQDIQARWANLSGYALIQTSGLASGIYVVSCITEDNHQYQQKLVLK